MDPDMINCVILRIYVDFKKRSPKRDGFWSALDGSKITRSFIIHVAALVHDMPKKNGHNRSNQRWQLSFCITA